MTGDADAPSQRIAGLDAWRALLMLGGLPVHASFWLERRMLFDVVEAVSQAFRMGAFFAIAGFLTALALARRPSRAWLLKRSVQLGVPIVFGMTILSPLVWLLVATRPPGGHGAIPPMFHWHHLWFLVGLLLYSVAAAGMTRIERAAAPVAQWVAQTPSTRVLLITAAASAASFAAVPPLMFALLPEAIVAEFVNLQLIAGYFPLFVLGFVLARAPVLRESVVAGWRSAAVIVVLVALSHIGWFALRLSHADAALTTRIGEIVQFIAAALCPAAAFVLILRSALAIRRVPPFLTKLSDASYTMYVVHFPVMVALNTRMDRLGFDPQVQFAITVVVGGVASYAIHRLAVRRSRSLALLLNGRIPSRGGAAFARLAEH